ncbi:MAG: phosphoribosylformylglycinamidine synthase subunit PurQ, partial [Rhizobiales bacterium]|nr:phosphoribosylformylglycinamidine synthase subunit PurQ [Hyphomicrobiales bacterium]
MRSAVILFPGSNRDRDMVSALSKILGRKPVVVWHMDPDLPDVDLVVLPGGFSYGDYLRSGAIAARSPVMRAVAAKADAGVPVLGICNGFQILCESGILPGVLMRNASLRFICREAHLRVETTDSAFTRLYGKGEVIRCPVAHGDGNYRVDGDMLARLKDEDRIAFRYADAAGRIDEASNINGSVESIA